MSNLVLVGHEVMIASQSYPFGKTYWSQFARSYQIYD